MQKSHIISAKQTLEITTQELQSILDHVLQTCSGTHLEMVEAIRCLRSAISDLQKAEQSLE